MKFLSVLLLLSCLLVFLSPAFSQEPPTLRLASALERSGRHAEAYQLYRQMFDSEMHTVQVIGGIKNTLTALGRYEELVDFYESLLMRYPGQLNYHIDLGRAYYLSRNEAKAFETWKTVYELDSQNATAYRLLAMTLIELRLIDAAVEVYQKAIRNAPRQESLYRDIASLYKAQLNYELAVENLLYFYQFHRNQIGYVRSQLVSMARDEETVAKIITALKTYLKDHPAEDELVELLATMYIKGKNFEEAFRIYENLQNKNKERNYLSRFAAEAENNGAYRFAIRAYQILLDDQKNESARIPLQYSMARSYYSMGRLNFSNGNTAIAEQNVREALRMLDELIQKHTRSSIIIGSIELKGDIYSDYYNDLDQAIANFQEILRLKPNQDISDRMRLKLGDLFLMKNNLIEAQKYYSQVNSQRHRQQGAFRLAELIYYQARFNDASERFTQLLEETDSKNPLTNDILERILLIERFSSDSLSLAKYSRAELLLRQNKQSQAAKQFMELYQKPNPLRFQAGLQAAQLYYKLEQFDQSELILLDLINDESDHKNLDAVYYLLAEVYSAQHKYQLGLNNYRVILLNYPGSFYVDEARDKARQISVILEGEKTP